VTTPLKKSGQPQLGSVFPSGKDVIDYFHELLRIVGRCVRVTGNEILSVTLKGHDRSGTASTKSFYQREFVIMTSCSIDWIGGAIPDTHDL
jgi:hypothetical protein